MLQNASGDEQTELRHSESGRRSEQTHCRTHGDLQEQTRRRGEQRNPTCAGQCTTGRIRGACKTTRDCPHRQPEQG
jgi:hypothetical protein